MRDIVDRIRLEDDQISEVTLFDRADVRAGFAAEEFRRLTVLHCRICMGVSPASFMS